MGANEHNSLGRERVSKNPPSLSLTGHCFMHSPKPRFAAPASLREALALSYQYKREVRWFAGNADLIEVDYSRVPSDAFIIDARGISEFSQVAVDSSVRIGAFLPRAVIEAHAAIAEIGALRGSSWSPAELCALDARLILISEGQLREVELLKLCSGPAFAGIEPYELPLHIVFVRPGPHAALIERRRHTKDGAATFDQRVAVSLALAAGGRTAHVRIIAHLLGVQLVRVRAAEACLQHVKPTKELVAEAAREAARLFAATDKRTSAALRSLPPMVLAALGAAIDRAKR